jgi:malate dehydrogenase (oxaloacetate-decarboxylating)(NADP+)
MTKLDKSFLADMALAYHRRDKPGKISISPTKPLFTQEDLSLAYSPGVAEPVKEISKDINALYEYTAKGNLVAVISNGSAILGLGNLGAAAAKPVMEGKAVLFKKFADIDSIDLELDTSDTQEFINCVKYLACGFGGINLEDIKAPECFDIEDRLVELLDIPIFHDDQHGTAIIAVAGLINAARVANKDFKKLKIVVNGAGAAAIACLDLLVSYGIEKENILLCDTKGVVYQGRCEGMNKWKSKYAAKTDYRTLEQAMRDADVFLGLSVKGAVSKEMIKSMAPRPIVFALSNPDPEITPEDIRSVSSDAIIATGRSDYPNQINNLMGFPYIFRGALDVRAKTINLPMKIAAANALADLALQVVPTEVSRANSDRKMEFGPDYIIPSPFDPRLITTIAVAVAKAAIESGVAKITTLDVNQYKASLLSRMDPTANYMNLIFQKASSNKRILFAEGEDPETIKAALQIRDNFECRPILVGRQHKIHEVLISIGKKNLNDIEIINAATTDHLDQYIKFFYSRTQRSGYLQRDCNKLVKTDKNIFAACVLASGHADSLITGNVQNYEKCFQDIGRVIDAKHKDIIFKYYSLISKERYIMIVEGGQRDLSAEDMAYITLQSAGIMKNIAIQPRVAWVSYENFARCKYAKRTDELTNILDAMNLDFEYDGNMCPDVALDENLKRLYPFCKLSGPANILIMPDAASTTIALKLLQQISCSTSVFGPILSGFNKSVQILQIGSSASEIINLTAISLVEDLT